MAVSETAREISSASPAGSSKRSLVEAAWISVWFTAGDFSIKSVDFRWAILLAGFALLVTRPSSSRVRSRSGSFVVANYFVVMLFQILSLYGAEFGSIQLRIVVDLGFLLAFLAVTARLPVVTRGPSSSVALTSLLVGSVFFIGAALRVGGSLTARWSAFGGGPNVFARIMALGIIAILGLAIEKRDSRAWFLLAPFVVAIVAAQSRGGLLAVIAALLVFFVAHSAVGSRRRIAGALVGVGAIVLAIRLLSPQSYNRLLFRYFSEASRNRGTETRFGIFTDAADAWASELFLGIGLGDFGSFATGDAGFDGEFTTHNYLLGLAAESGLFPVLFAVAFIAIVLHAVLFVASNGSGLFSSFNGVAWLFLLFSSQLSGGYYDARGIWLFGMLALVDRDRLSNRRHQRSANVNPQCATDT